MLILRRVTTFVEQTKLDGFLIVGVARDDEFLMASFASATECVWAFGGDMIGDRGETDSTEVSRVH